MGNVIGTFLEKRLIPFFDSAYQGFGKGLDKDADAIRMFAREGHEMLVAYSFSKNFSLYAERTGALFVICDEHKQGAILSSKLVGIIRANYSNPPQHGARIVTTVLKSPALKKEWEHELEAMRQRVRVMRAAFTSKLNEKSTKIDFSF